MKPSAFYFRWVMANAWSELLGLGATALLGWWVVRSTGEPASVIGVVAVASLAVAGGTLFEGVIVGYAQARALRARLPALAGKRWIVATAVGAGVAWMLGMLPSTVMALAAPQPAAAPPAWLEGPGQYLLAAVLGLLLGPVLGFPQSLMLRPHARRTGRWVLANALAWGCGMPVVFLGASSIPAQGAPGLVLAIVGLACLGAGAVVGAVHGLFLIRLLPPPEATVHALHT